MLYIDQAEHLDDYKVVIASPKAGIRLTGLLDDEEFSYSSSANLGTGSIASSVEGATKGIGKAIAGKLPGGQMLSNMVGDNFKTAKSTILGYDGADNSSFTVSMHFFPNKLGNGSYKNIELQLSKLTQPNVKNISDQLASYIYDPSDTAGFLTGGDPFKGKLVSLSVGNWFNIVGMLLPDSVSRNYSKFVDTKNKPIYLSASLTFKTYRVINAEEISSWILK